MKDSFGERLQRLRESKGLSRYTLADKLGTTVTSLASWEKDMFLPSTLSIIDIASFFDVSADYLLGLPEEKLTILPNITVKAINSLNGKELERVVDYVEYVYYIHKTKGNEK